MISIDNVFAESESETPTSSIIYATAVSDSVDGIVRVVFDQAYELDEDGEPLDYIVVDDDDAADNIDEDYDSEILGPDDEGYIEGEETYVEEDEDTIVDEEEQL